MRSGSKEADIIDGGGFFYIGSRNGPWVLKRSGKGRVLAELLKVGTLTLEEIARVSGWQNPKREMRRFEDQINAWSKGYRLDVVGSESGGTDSYRLELSPNVAF